MVNTGRKPVSVASNNRKLVWKAIRELKEFTVKNIFYKTDVQPRTVLSYLQNLEKAGILDKNIDITNGCLKTNKYTLIKDMGLLAPVVNKNGKLVENTKQARIWRAIRILKTFTLKDAVATASTEDDPIILQAAEQYLNYLRKAGYLIWLKKDKTYRLNLAMNKGIQAPQIQRIRQVYDPNIDKVVWNSEEI